MSYKSIHSQNIVLANFLPLDINYLGFLMDLNYLVIHSVVEILTDQRKNIRKQAKHANKHHSADMDNLQTQSLRLILPFFVLHPCK